MSFFEDAARGTAVFTLSAAPDLMEDRNVKRMRAYEIAYSFRDPGNGTVEIVVTGRTSPPADGLRRFVKLAKTM